MAEVEQVTPGLTEVRDGALTELERLTKLIGNLAPADWLVPSAATGWSIGEVIAHLDLFLGLYHRLLGRLLAGDPWAGLVATTLDRLDLSAMPSTAPIFDAVNGAIPKAVARLMAPQVLQRWFVTGAGRTREVLLREAPDEYPGSGLSKGWANLLSFFLAIAVNELAIHDWDMESRIGEAAGLSDSARLILPWFYWSATKLMLRLPRRTNGTVLVLLSEPASAMWWSITDGCVDAGRGTASQADLTIRISSERYVLGVAGRLTPAEVLESPTAVEGDQALADCFLSAWHLI
jgi:uncharacterized protein (TIGR03083 family)